MKDSYLDEYDLMVCHYCGTLYNHDDADTVQQAVTELQAVDGILDGCCSGCAENAWGVFSHNILAKLNILGRFQPEIHKQLEQKGFEIKKSDQTE
jgi:hypothetical protein